MEPNKEQLMRALMAAMQNGKVDVELFKVGPGGIEPVSGNELHEHGPGCNGGCRPVVIENNKMLEHEVFMRRELDVITADLQELNAKIEERVRTELMPRVHEIARELGIADMKVEAEAKSHEIASKNAKLTLEVCQRLGVPGDTLMGNDDQFNPVMPKRVAEKFGLPHHDL